jgi:hypothetical protein
MWVVLLDSKAATTDAIKRHQANLEKGCSARTRRRVHGAEFVGYCADEGIQRHYFAPYSP